MLSSARICWIKLNVTGWIRNPVGRWWLSRLNIFLSTSGEHCPSHFLVILVWDGLGSNMQISDTHRHKLASCAAAPTLRCTARGVELGAEKAATEPHLCCRISLKSTGVLVCHSKEKRGDILLYAIYQRASAAECRTPAPQDQKIQVMGKSVKVKHQTWGKWDPGVSIKASKSEAEKTRGILIKWVHKGAVFPIAQSCLSFSFIYAFLPCWQQHSMLHTVRIKTESSNEQTSRQ